MVPIKRLPEKVVRSLFWKQVNAYNNIGDLPDEFYREAVKEMVNGDPSYDGYYASLDEWKKNDDELPEE